MCMLCTLLQVWPGHAAFRDAERQFWRHEDYGSMVLGYIKSYSKLTHVVIRNAGHMVSWLPSVAAALSTKFQP